jgi:hypothetical protein
MGGVGKILMAATVGIGVLAVWLVLFRAGDTSGWVRVAYEDHCLLVDPDAPELRDVRVFQRGGLTAHSFVVDILPEHASDGMSLSFNHLRRQNEAIVGTPPTYSGDCQFASGPFGFDRQRDGKSLCHVGPHRTIFVRNAGFRSVARVICYTPSGRCGMTLFEDAPPLQFAVSLAMGDTPPEHWQTLEARVRSFVSENVVPDADCGRWWPLRWMEG